MLASISNSIARLRRTECNEQKLISFPNECHLLNNSLPKYFDVIEVTIHTIYRSDPVQDDSISSDFISVKRFNDEDFRAHQNNNSANDVCDSD